MDVDDGALIVTEESENITMGEIYGFPHIMDQSKL